MVLSTLLAFLLLSDRPLDFGSVTEAEHNPLFGINGQGVDHGVPKPLIEFGHKILCPAQLFSMRSLFAARSETFSCKQPSAKTT